MRGVLVQMLQKPVNVFKGERDNDRFRTLVDQQILEFVTTILLMKLKADCSVGIVLRFPQKVRLYPTREISIILAVS